MEKRGQNGMVGQRQPESAAMWCQCTSFHALLAQSHARSHPCTFDTPAHSENATALPVSTWHVLWLRPKDRSVHRLAVVAGSLDAARPRGNLQRHMNVGDCPRTLPLGVCPLPPISYPPLSASSCSLPSLASLTMREDM